MKDKHLALQARYRELYKQYEKYKAQVEDNEHIQKLETICIGRGLMGELEVMTQNRWVSGKRFQKMKEERDNFSKWYWETKEELNNLIRGRQHAEEQKL